MSDDSITLESLARCFEGAVPAVIATMSADGRPNVIYLSCVRMVDRERVALSNQFFSKTSQNLAQNPYASLVVVDPATHFAFRLAISFERTERRGKTFERLRADVDHVAALSHMQDVFKLRAADIYRVERIEQIRNRAMLQAVTVEAGPRAGVGALAALCAQLNRASDLNALVEATVAGLETLGYPHSSLMLLDESGERLYTIASRGYLHEAVGSEAVLGEGVSGMAALRCAPMRVGNLRTMQKYSQTVRREFEAAGAIGPGREIDTPSLPDVKSRMAVPAMTGGQLIGVLVVDSTEMVAFDDPDEEVLSVVASIVAGSIEALRSEVAHAEGVADRSPRQAPLHAETPRTRVRFFDADGSVFFGSDYVIKGVAGRLLWRLLNHWVVDGRVEFTNRELRLDPALALPDFRDNFESRLILLKRRLDENEAVVRIEKTGRGKFRLDITVDLDLEFN